jgi:hypothetical protein
MRVPLGRFTRRETRDVVAAALDIQFLIRRMAEGQIFARQSRQTFWASGSQVAGGGTNEMLAKLENAYSSERHVVGLVVTHEIRP